MTMAEFSKFVEEERKRFHARDVREMSDEGFLNFAEYMLDSINFEMNNTLRKISDDIDSAESKKVIGEFERFFVSPYYNAISMGHGLDILIHFREECQKIRDAKNNPKLDTYKDRISTIDIKEKFASAREKMKFYRKASKKSFKELADLCECSEGLLRMVESGEVTHPIIASKIAEVFHLTKKEAEELVPEIHRPSSPYYEPDKFVAYEEAIQSMPPNMKRDQMDCYIADRKSKAVRNHERRPLR